MQLINYRSSARSLCDMFWVGIASSLSTQMISRKSDSSDDSSSRSAPDIALFIELILNWKYG